MAMADLGVMELCRLGCLEVSFSPLIERRMALTRSNESAPRPSPDEAVLSGAQQSKQRDDIPSWPIGDSGDNDVGRNHWHSGCFGFVQSRRY